MFETATMQNEGASITEY